MIWTVMIALLAAGVLGWVVLPGALLVLGSRFVKRHVLKAGDDFDQPRLGGAPAPKLLPDISRNGCPPKEREELRKLETRLYLAHDTCEKAINTRLTSELARARIAPMLEDAFLQIRDEIASIYAFCDRNDLTGMIKKASASPTTKDIYLEAYARDLKKVREAISKTEECLAAYERTVATLEVSSVEANIDSDFDASIEMLKDLRSELPQYNLADRI